MNTVNLIGRLTNDPLPQQTRSGHSVTIFRIAVDRDYRIKGKPYQKTDFFDVEAWNDKAQFVAKYFRVGQRIGVSGYLQSHDYTNKNGNKRTAIEVVATSVDFAGDAPKRKQEQ